MKNIYRVAILRKNTSGFTLVELLTAVAITGLVITIAGFGLVAILQASQKAEAKSDMRTDLNRGLDFISDDIKAASYASNTAPSWAWTDLGEGSPQGKVYLRIPNTIVSMSEANERITISNNSDIANGNAVMFGGSGTVSAPLIKNQVYYVKNYDNSPVYADTFQVSVTVNGSIINLSTNATGSLMASQLIIYYVRNNITTWLGPKTINRSTGNCISPSNCPVLIDSVAANGFPSPTVASDRQVSLSLMAQTCLPLTNSNTCSNPETYQVSTNAFARSASSP